MERKNADASTIIGPVGKLVEFIMYDEGVGSN